MQTTAAQAQNTEVWVIDRKNLSVSPTTLYYWVMESAEKTTTPHGIANKLHFEQRNENFVVFEWGHWGNGRQVIETVATETDAEDAIFNRVYNKDFMRDDQRDTEYYQTKNEAEKALIEHIASVQNMTLEVACSWYGHKQLADRIRAMRNAPRKYHKFEIYTTTGETIEIVSVQADTIQHAKKLIRKYPNFEEVILHLDEYKSTETARFLQHDGNRGIEIVKRIF